MGCSLFRYTTQVRVRNYELDWQGIVHNANYLLYCEVGRLAYLQNLGLSITLDTIRDDARIVVVRNEINYRSPALFNELLDVRTRISAIGRTSFTFEGLIEETTSLRLVAENVSVHVWLDRETGKPLPVPGQFRTLVGEFEGKKFSAEKHQGPA